MLNNVDEKHIIKKLNEIGISLSMEKDVNKLLDIILNECMEITKSDAGSLYIIETKNIDKVDIENVLRFKIAKNISRDIPFLETTMPLDTNSLVGYSVLNNKILNIKNVEEYAKLKNIKYNRKFDEEIKYKSSTMLVVPMKNFSGKVIGVIQLINKKNEYLKKIGISAKIEDEVFQYNEDEEKIIESLSSQAAILLERTKLYENIETLFNSFVETMVATIDARDLTTSGHSRRLAGYALGFAKAINRIDYGKYKDFKFTKEEIKELYFASLLHDVGKIGVKEEVLVKKNRLSDDRISIIGYKFNIHKNNLKEKGEIDLKKYDEMYQFLVEINKKGFITNEEEAQIKDIATIEFIDIDGDKKNIVDEFELSNLTIKKGNLTDNEKDEMNSHALQSYEILKKINWIDSLKNVPMIAACHHEKINGSGYPWGKIDEDIPIQSKIITILDIYEALTARDRPYKPPMPIEKALQILEFEVKANTLDKDLYDIFINEKIYEMYKEELDKIVKL
ncbi:MAG: GAF domain-containing protein [Fusobacteria bacterium]|nr:GAF domain-containing protein [Fusobacteriota bacterium]